MESVLVAVMCRRDERIQRVNLDTAQGRLGGCFGSGTRTLRILLPQFVHGARECWKGHKRARGHKNSQRTALYAIRAEILVSSVV